MWGGDFIKTFLDEFMMPKKQRGGLHYNMNKGTNFRVDET